MMAGMLLLGAAAGIAVTRWLHPEYKVHSTLWISTGTSQNEEGAVAPIRADETMSQASWPELLTSFAILEKAVRRTSLYVVPASRKDRPLFVGFDTDAEFHPGTYELRVSDAGWQYKLLDGDGKELHAGVLGDSIGRALGFRWKPPAAALSPGRRVRFTLLTPRETALALSRRLATTFSRESNLLGVTLSGTDPVQITSVMNAMLDEFVTAAAELKKRSLTEVGKALKRQLDAVETELKQGETVLDGFNTQSATLPVESPMAIGSTAEAHNPLLDSYFVLQGEEANVRSDRVAVERTLAAVRAGTIEASALSAVPAVQGDAAADLRAALSQLSTRRAELRAAQRTYTDDHKAVRGLASEVNELSAVTIPRLGMALVADLRRREQELRSQLQTAALQLRGIPARSMEERRLRRSVEAAGTLYDTLKKRYDAALLAERNTSPDVSILEPPVAPEQPSSDRAPEIILLAVMLSGAAAMTIAVLRDRFDTRFRYPEQAADDMGLDVVGMVPVLEQSSARHRNAKEEAQLVEAFRGIRMHLTHAFDPTGTVTLTVTSPVPGDGKSFVSAHLAKAFADAGRRTVIVDGDLRRGGLHANFAVARQPGLLEYLLESSTLDDVLRDTPRENLAVLPRGGSDPRAAERLMSPRIAALMTELGRRFDVIIVDSPPLGAGIDPLVLGTATSSILLVLRAGETDRGMAHAKLKLLARLPIRLLGAVLNGMRDEGGFSHQAYSDWDLSEDEVQVPETAWRRARRLPLDPARWRSARTRSP
jgi:capsular exopolysaccharide synthesis family protein